MEREALEPAVALVAGTAALFFAAVPAPCLSQVGIESPPPALAELAPGPAVSDLPAFLRGTTLTLRLRTYLADVRPPVGVEREAWAAGGWVAYRSGWLRDAAQIGATYFASAPLHAPQDKGDTLLLAPGKEGYHVLGEAFAALRYREYAVLKGYRQRVDLPYVNGQDNAMTPNTFEGVTLAGKVGPTSYVAGFLTRIKPRNAERFVSMSEEAGAPGSDEGMALLGLGIAPLRGLSVEVHEQYGVNTFNTLFAQAEHVQPLGGGVRLQLGVQLTDQRAVGDALVAGAQEARWATQNGSARVALVYRDLTLRAAASATARGNRIQNPWGFYPGYLRLSQISFANANEKAWLAGAAFDFSGSVLPGLSASIDLARGVDSIHPATRAALPDEAEYDLVVTYAPPAVEGLRLRVRALLHDQEGARMGRQIRIIVNWEIPVIRAAEPGPGPGGAGPSGERDRRTAGRIATARGACPH